MQKHRNLISRPTDIHMKFEIHRKLENIPAKITRLENPFKRHGKPRARHCLADSEETYRLVGTHLHTRTHTHSRLAAPEYFCRTRIFRSVPPVQQRTLDNEFPSMERSFPITIHTGSYRDIRFGDSANETGTFYHLLFVESSTLRGYFNPHFFYFFFFLLIDDSEKGVDSIQDADERNELFWLRASGF